MAEHIELEPKTFRQKIENFWYHYKLHTILAVFIAAVLIVGVAQCASKSSYDYYIVVAFDKYSYPEVDQAFKNYFERIGEDVNSDGKVTVNIIDVSRATDRGEQHSNSEKLLAETMRGTVILYITDEYYFNKLDSEGVFDAVDYLPDKDHKAKNLYGTPVCTTVNDAHDNFIENDFYISKRVVTGTAVDNRQTVLKNEKSSVKLLKRLLAECE